MTASTMTAAFNATADLLSDSANTINAERLKGAALRSFRKSINATAKAVAAATEAEHLYTWSSFYHYSDRLEVTITGQLNGLDSLKDKRLFDALDTIERKTGAQFADSKDDLYYEAPTREFIAALTVTPPTPHSAAAKLLLLTIRVVASVRGDSESCRRVQTGVTMRETPVYAIQCD